MTSPLPSMDVDIAGDSDHVCHNLFHPTSPAVAMVRLCTHGCSRDHKYLYACGECADWLLEKRGVITCMACVLDHALPLPVKAVEGRWLK